MLETRSKFIGKSIAWAAASGAGGIATLNHEVRNDAVKCQSVIEAVGGEIQEIGDGDRGLAGVERCIDISLGGVEDDADILGFISRRCGPGDAVGHRESGGECKKCLFHGNVIG